MAQKRGSGLEGASKVVMRLLSDLTDAHRVGEIPPTSVASRWCPHDAREYHASWPPRVV